MKIINSKSAKELLIKSKNDRLELENQRVSAVQAEKRKAAIKSRKWNQQKKQMILLAIEGKFNFKPKLPLVDPYELEDLDFIIAATSAQTEFYSKFVSWHKSGRYNESIFSAYFLNWLANDDGQEIMKSIFDDIEWFASQEKDYAYFDFSNEEDEGLWIFDDLKKEIPLEPASFSEIFKYLSYKYECEMINENSCRVTISF